MGMQTRTDQRRDRSLRSFLRLIRKAQRALKNHQRDRARDFLREATEMLPPPADAALPGLKGAILEASRVATELDGSKKLAAVLREYLRTDSQDEDLWIALIGVFRAGNKLEEALQACDEGIRACVDPSRIMLAKAEMLLRERRGEAMEILWRLATGENVAERAIDVLEAEGEDAARIHILKAARLRREGMQTEALEELDAALEADPRSVEALEAKSSLFVALERWQDALGCIQEALGIESTRPLLWQLKAKAEEASGDPEEAIRSLQVSLRYAPEDIPTMKRLGDLLMAGGRYEEASEVLERAADLAPHDVEALELWSQALEAMSRWTDVLTVLDKILELQPERNDLRLRAAMALLHEGHGARVQEFLDRVVESASDTAILGRAARIAEQAEMWTTALSAAEAALRREPSNGSLGKLKVRALVGLGRREDALRALNRFSRITRDAEALELKLALLKSLKKPKVVFRCCQDLLKLDPDREDVYLDMAEAALEMGRTEAALRACDRGLRRFSSSVDLRLKKAAILLQADRTGEACRVYEEVTRLKPDSFEAWRGYGLSLYALRSYPEAAEALEAALRLQDDWECWHYRGLSLRGMDKLGEATECFKMAVAVSDRTQSWLALGSCLLENGHPQDALHALDRALELDPDNPEAILRKAECYMRLKEHGEAISTLDDGLKRHREDLNLLYARIQCLLELGQPQEAYDSSVALTDLAGDDPHAWMLRADVTKALGLTTEALDCLKEAARLLPRDPAPRLKEVSILLEVGEYEAALEVCAEATSLDGVLGAIHRLRGEALAGLDRHEEALMAFEQALAVDGGDKEALRGRSLSLARIGRHEEAIKSVDVLVSMAPSDSMGHYWKAVILSEAKRWEEALGSLNQALYYGGSNPTILALKGRVLLEMGRGEEGLRLVEDALSTHTEQADLMKVQTSILLALGRHEEALKRAEAILSRFSRDWELWLLRAEAQTNLDRREEAVESMQMALRFGRSSKVVWTRCSSLYLRLGQEEASLACYDQALALDPRDADLWISRGRLCETLGRWREATESYSSALEVRPRDEDVLCSLGRSYTHLGLHEEALDAYQEAIAINPTSEKALKGSKEVEERRREEIVKAYAWRVLEFEAVNERPATKEEVFKHCNVPMDLLDEVLGYVNEPPALDILSLSEQELRRLEDLSRDVLASTSGLGLPRLSQLVRECPYVDAHEARQVLGYVKGVLEMDPPVDQGSGLERLMKMALDLPREEWNALSLARSLRIGAYEARRLEAALRIFSEGKANAEAPAAEGSRDQKTCRKHGAAGIYEHFCGQYLCSACIIGGRCPVCRHPVSRALSGFRAQEGPGSEVR